VVPVRIVEMFGPTFQGEGPSVGKRAVFLRLWGCNLDCSWCDTPYTWDIRGKNGTVFTRAEESDEWSLETIAERFVELSDGTECVLVITGGEPLIQQDQIISLLELLPGVNVEVETNGTILPEIDDLRVSFNISPKLESANTTRDPIRLEALREFAELHFSRVAFKFVSSTPGDLNEVAQIVDEASLDPAQVWIMPEGRDAQTILNTSRTLAQDVLNYGYNLTTRLHVLLWDDLRGV
jgi:organic radical activating enzyme